jgi:hypothetical protein
LKKGNLKQKFIIFSLFAILIISMLFYNTYLFTKYSQLSEEQSEYNSVQTSLNALKASLNNNKYSSTKLINKTDFINFLGNETTPKGLTVTNLKCGEPIVGDTQTCEYSFTVRGQLNKISNFVTALKNLKTGYEITSISLKKEDGTLWNQVANSSDTITWAQFESGATTSSSETVITSNYLMSDSNYSLSLDLVFIGTLDVATSSLNEDSIEIDSIPKSSSRSEMDLFGSVPVGNQSSSTSGANNNSSTSYEVSTYSTPDSSSSDSSFEVHQVYNNSSSSSDLSNNK